MEMSTMSQNEPWVFVGEDIDGQGPISIQHRPSVGEVIIRAGESIVAAVDAAEFFSGFEALP